MPDLLDMVKELEEEKLKKIEHPKKPVNTSKKNSNNKSTNEKEIVSKSDFVGYKNYDSFEASIEDTIIIQEQKLKRITTEKAPVLDLENLFENLAKTSEFRRLIYKALVGTVHRGSKEDLNQKLKISLEKFRRI